MDILILFPFVLSCAFSDAITQHIPNRLILCGLIGAILARGSLVCRSPFLLVDGLAGFLLPWLVIGPLAALKMFGGGDVKLLSVIGLWLGARRCLMVMWHALLIAAVWSVVLVIRRRNLIWRLSCLYRYAGKIMRSGRLFPYRGSVISDSMRFGDSVSGAMDPSGKNGTYKAMDFSGEFCFAVPIFLAFWLNL